MSDPQNVDDERAVFRDMEEADLEHGLRLSRASGWNQTVEDWRTLLALGPGLFRVGVLQGSVAASGGAVRYGDSLAWICMILVDPAFRGRGLGTRVFDEVLERVVALVDAGRLRSVGLDATPDGRRIYLQRGFVDGPALVRLRAARPVALAAAAGAARVRPMGPDDLGAVLARDRDVFGAERGRLLRDAWAAAPALAWVTRGGSALRRYCFGRHGDHSDHIGPVVADDLEDALALVAAGRSQVSRPLILDARVEPSWLAELEALGFEPQRPFTRMYRGDARPPGRPSLERAVRGPEFG